MPTTHTYDVATPTGRVRLLLSDVASPWVFSDEEIGALLDLEGQSVKRAAAQAIDTNADNQALASKVLKTKDLSTDGAAVADALRKRAASLRAQATDEDADGEDGGYMTFVPMNGRDDRPELTARPYGWL